MVSEKNAEAVFKLLSPEAYLEWCATKDILLPREELERAAEEAEDAEFAERFPDVDWSGI